MTTKKEDQVQQKNTEGDASSNRALSKLNGQSRLMPKDYAISLAAKGGTDRQLLNPATERVQSMRGFEDTYTDIIDYIVRITHRIWEEKDIGYIYDTYKHNSHV